MSKAERHETTGRGSRFPYESAIPSITSFRERLHHLLLDEANGTRRDVIVLALDGVGHALARDLWSDAKIEKMRSVFPTTSSSAWLSALTGADVDAHGVPGVAFRLQGPEVINVYDYDAPLGAPPTGNIFSDARAAGYAPLAIVGDWEPYVCEWVNLLLTGARRVSGHRFYSSPEPRGPDALVKALDAAVAEAREGFGAAPRLVWCFVEVDKRVHEHGFDEAVVEFLRLVEPLARRLAQRGAVVVAHSDHGLVRTRHDRAIEALMTSVATEMAAGGAGRTRWFYPPPRARDRLVARLERELPPDVRIRSADEVFRAGSLARSRVGDVVLVAQGEDFVTSPGHRYDHGSDTELEVFVPYAVWGGHGHA